MSTIEAEIFTNLQGDEPLLQPEAVELLVAGMRAGPSIDVGTLCHPLPANEASNPNSVKVVLTNNSDALYFSRRPILYPHDATRGHLPQVCRLCAYRRHVLESFPGCRIPCWKKPKNLNSCALLAAGYRIRAFEVAPTGPGVNIPQCLERVRVILSGNTEPLSATPA
jgi:CMP-2-keto-3-deoxyoctulosonic acid synthetase